jgi:hypothetical protein
MPLNARRLRVDIGLRALSPVMENSMMTSQVALTRRVHSSLFMSVKPCAIGKGFNNRTAHGTGARYGGTHGVGTRERRASPVPVVCPGRLSEVKVPGSESGDN